MRLALFNPAHMADFRVGLPKPGPGEAICEKVDYASLAFPEGYHVIAGLGLAYTDEGYFVGRSHQDCKHFEPERVRVHLAMCGDGQARRCLRLVGGYPGHPGAGNVWHEFDEPLTWEQRHALRIVVEFKPIGPAPLFCNIEPRGMLDTKPHEEAYCPIGFSLVDWGIKLHWWNNIRPGQDIAGRQAASIHFPLRLNVWHTLRALIRPLPGRNLWEAEVEISRQNESAYWSLRNLPIITNTIGFDRLYVGDEHDLPKNEDGGTFLFSKIAAWKRPLRRNEV